MNRGMKMVSIIKSKINKTEMIVEMYIMNNGRPALRWLDPDFTDEPVGIKSYPTMEMCENEYEMDGIHDLQS